MPRKAIDLTDRPFDRLTAVKRVLGLKNGSAQWLCSCSCGGSTVANARNLIHRRTRSCGCLAREHAQALGQKYGKLTSHYIHGMTRHWLYSTYTSIRQRCENEARKDFKWYGGDTELGPASCLFRDFQQFLAEVEKLGPRPLPEHTVDRLPGQRNYGPGTLRWASKAEQTVNRVIRTRRTKIARLAEDKLQQEARLAEYIAEHQHEMVEA